LYLRSQNRAPDHNTGKTAKTGRFQGDYPPFTWKSGDFKKNKKNACNQAKICDIIFETLQLGTARIQKKAKYLFISLVINELQLL
jgi:hypothetical protein